MHRRLLIWVTLWLLSAAMYAADGLPVDSLPVGYQPVEDVRADSLPVVEVRADRTVIYPQRMELTGEETLMDMLQLVPYLVIAGYEEVFTYYNLRIDNVPMNGDNRLILSQMRAKDIDKIQVCDNTGVAKGTIGTNYVLDINMKMPDAVSAFVEGQGGFGKDAEGNGTANALYGSKSTDLYANATYRYQEEKHKEYVTLHMTNRFDDRNKLLTYFTQQFVEKSVESSRKVLGRARYFHTFNDMGTELMVLGGYQYASDAAASNKLPMYVLELNTPLFTKRLSMMLGVEGDFLFSEQKGRDWSWDIYNQDIYLQFTYALPRWKFTAGNRVMFYGYKLKNEDDKKRYSDTRNNTNVCVVYVPDGRHQLQLGYFRKYYNPSYEALFMNSTSLEPEDWLYIEDNLDEWDINQFKLGYAYSRQKFTVQAEASYYVIDGEENSVWLGASAYWKTKGLTLTGGANYHIAESGGYAMLRMAPTLCLPADWRIGMQMVCFTKKASNREVYGTPLYGCLSVNKLFGRHWLAGIDWHDMFDAFCSEAKVNRHAVNVKVQYRF